ncbi:hypothetical protein Bca4012_056744 [Brassica carinata]
MVILGLRLIDHTGFAGAASRYLGLKIVMQLLGLMLVGRPGVVFKRLKHQDTQRLDYARILRAIYAFANCLKGIVLFNFQIRITRTYRLPCK